MTSRRERASVRFGLACVLLPLALTAQTSPPVPVEFERDVLPILRDRCFECHQAPRTLADGRVKKPKGGLRLDGRGFIEHGGDGGAIVVAGDADGSELIVRVRLPADDPDVMPAEGDPLPTAERELLERWVAGGATFGTWTGVAGPVDATPRRGPLPKSTTAVALEALADGLEAPAAAVLAKALAAHARIDGALGEDRRLLDVSFPAHRDDVDAAAVKTLTAVASQIATLDVARTAIDDGAADTIGRMERLVRLDLSGTSITSRGVARLVRLEHLRSLNLYATAVDDAVVDTLAALPALEVVYLWQTKVGDPAVAKLRAARPELRVVTAPALPAPPPADSAQDGRRRRR